MDLEQMRRKAVKFVRQKEERACGGNPERLAELATTSDDYLFKKALWTLFMIVGPICFVVLPVLISFFGIFLPPQWIAVLWTLAKVCMALTLFLFSVCLYLTMKGNI
ncbi:MAG TPA: hypothetical protein PKN86_04285 [Candidatus Obscuribacter sp.]|nr:hypothetical protein [Candidatus Obscuribacter sp.]MBK9282268.1 hypothetical protein [Candidatus Obscuribacter sp.]MBL8081613.1 hypothetical protein [Candidatus Obscuribacter sp.]HMW91164.1 hypothetical protein [Candidatus Obscuribacter sp.]HNB14198.1 hypothetical protein [Candidatus Obscuribacter sp.]